MKRPRPAFLPSDLGETRTILAADRTLMAWIRTSLSMLSFGFTIYKFLEGIAGPDAPRAAATAQLVGLFLAGTGTAAIIFGTTGYWATLSELQRIEEFRVGRPVLLLALIMSLAGVALFVAIAGRLI
jgi:putative membrane protein